MDQKVSRLIAEPFKTGLEQLRVARALLACSPEDEVHRSDRYKDALRSFDRAFGIATDSEKPLLSLLRGVVALNVIGASREAAIHFQDVKTALLASVPEIAKREAREQTSARAQEMADKFDWVVQGSTPIGRGAISDDEIEKAAWLHELRVRTAKLRDLAKARGEVEAMIRLLDELVACLMPVG